MVEPRWHDVKVGPRPQDLGTRDPSQSLKVGSEDPLQSLKLGPQDPFQSLNVVPPAFFNEFIFFRIFQLVFTYLIFLFF